MKNAADSALESFCAAPHAAQQNCNIKGTPVADETRKPPPVTIKKYANRRLYNTATSSYVTLDHLAEMVKKGVDFAVFDAKTGDDITRSVLAQIIFDEESSGQQLLPVQFLRQLIQFYGDSVQAFVPSYLEMSIKSFAAQQERMREQMAAGANTPLSIFEETVRQNMALFEQGMRMMSPFAAVGGKPSRSSEPAKPASDDLSDLKAQVAALQARLDRMGE